MSATLPRIVVVGGGAGGLPLATRLGKKLGRKGLAEITLVDDCNVHVWKPRFHEVATGAIDADLDAVSYRAHARRNHYIFDPGRLQSVDADQQRLRLEPLHDENGRQVLPERDLDYDYLVLALGSRCNDFGTPGVHEHCLFLDSRAQAERFREQFLNTCLRANHEQRSLSVAIVGGGATGVELAAELHNAVDMLRYYGHEQLDRSRLDVQLVEAAPRLLPALSERVSEAARQRLETLGVRVHTDTMVECTEAGRFVPGRGEPIEADLLVWAAGVRAPALLSEIPGLETNRVNQLVVDDELRARGQARIFALGDCAACQPAGHSRPLPPRAQSAQQMARHLARELERMVVTGQPPRPFVYQDRGSLISLSNYSSLGMLMGGLKGGSFFVEGWLARMMYISLYRLHQVVLHGWPRTLLLALGGHFRKLLRPRLKLH